MNARRLGFAAAFGAALLLSGCGGSGSSTTEISGTKLTIYSSLPLSGESAAAAQQIEDGEKLALQQAGGHAGPFQISYVSLNDANPKTGEWSSGESSENAKEAAQDISTIAYLGDYDSGATAISLPLLNGAGIVQVSPASPYVGLTSSLDAGEDDPGRFYLTGKRNFARLQPGDPVQAAAQGQLMAALGVGSVYVLYNDEDPFQEPLAQMVISEAEKRHMTVAGSEAITIKPGAPSHFKGEVEKVLATHPEAVFVAAGANLGSEQLWRELHEADPHLLLLGTSAMDSSAFTEAIGAAGSQTYLTTPLLPISHYPASARTLLAALEKTFGVPGRPEALYGYECMQVVLDAIRESGGLGNDRQTVIEHVLSAHRRNSVIGAYSIQSDGETTLTNYAADRVRDGQPVFFMETHGSVAAASP